MISWMSLVAAKLGPVFSMLTPSPSARTATTRRRASTLCCSAGRLSAAAWLLGIGRQRWNSSKFGRRSSMCYVAALAAGYHNSIGPSNAIIMVKLR